MCDMLHIKQKVWHSLKYKGSYIYIFLIIIRYSYWKQQIYISKQKFEICKILI